MLKKMKKYMFEIVTLIKKHYIMSKVFNKIVELINENNEENLNKIETLIEVLEKKEVNNRFEHKGINDYTLLIYASRNGYKEIVKLLLNREDINVNLKSKSW